MNREIKFRAWDSRRKIMYPNAQNTYDFMASEGGCMEENFKCVLEDDNYKVMQYTNCYDINGKEIYEGDVVEKEIMESIFDDSKLIGVVKMIEGCWCVVDDKKKVAKYLWSETDVNRVIGNIYENPELLEVR